MPSPPACAGPPTRTSWGVSGGGTGPCGRLRARPRSRTGSAGWTSPSAMREKLERARGVRRGPARRGLPRRGRARHGRLEPRARGLPPVLRQAGAGPDAARPGLDAPGPGARDARRARPRPGADDRLLEVGRDDRADVDVQGLPRAPGRRLALRRGDRSGQLARAARGASTASAQVFHGDPDIGGRYSALSAFGLVPAAAAGDRHRAPCSTRRSAPPRSAAASRATPGSGSAARSASSPARAATS